MKRDLEDTSRKSDKKPRKAGLEIRDRAGKAFWNSVWKGTEELPPPVDTSSTSSRHYVVNRFHEYFTASLRTLKDKDGTLLEVGCARSNWLPYFAGEFGFRVTGLDYSEIGCRLTELILERDEVAGRVIRGDLFAPPGDLVESFDVVFSFGVVEHFEDTENCIRALARFLRPGGLLITVVPNLTGLIGAIQKIVDSKILDRHVLLNREQVGSAHRKAGLSVIACRNFLVLHLGVVSLESWKERGIIWLLAYKTLERAGFDISRIVWLLERFVPRLKPNGFTSPYINCLARKA